MSEAQIKTEEATTVVLVRPRDFGSVPSGAPVQDPLGVGYLTAALRKRGHSVAVVDAHALDLDDEGVAACAAALKPSVVGISLHSFADYPHCVAISRRLAELSPRPYCIWGGEHATFHAERILQQHPEVDAVALGEGEVTICDLVDRFVGGDFAGDADRNEEKAAGRDRSLPVMGTFPKQALIGAVTRGDDGNILHGGYRESVGNLDVLPWPHKDIVELALQFERPVTISVLSGRGCTHSCSFCTAHEFMRLAGGTVWRRRSPASVVDELEYISNRYLNNPLVHPVVQFQDVIFLGTSSKSRDWVREFADLMEQRNLRLPFYCMSRADAILKNEDILPRLVEIGLWSIEMGIESGVDRILSLYDKQNNADDNEHAVNLMRKLGITFDASGYIMFDPRMTLDEVRINALYLSKFGAATWDFFVTRLQLYPGTVIREEMITKGYFSGVDDIGRTSGYTFEDPRVGEVADHTQYYNMSIRELDLLLRDAKALMANATRAGQVPPASVGDAVELVHETYCRHLLSLVNSAEAGRIREEAPELIELFMQRIAVLINLLREILTFYPGLYKSAAA